MFQAPKSLAIIKSKKFRLKSKKHCMRFFSVTSKHPSNQVNVITQKIPFFSFTGLIAIDFDMSILFLVFILVGVVTFLAGTAYGIYLNDKITEKEASNNFSRS